MRWMEFKCKSIKYSINDDTPSSPFVGRIIDSDARNLDEKHKAGDQAKCLRVISRSLTHSTSLTEIRPAWQRKYIYTVMKN